MNKVILVGNLTRDPELTETPSGVSVCRFSIAVSRDYANSEGTRETGLSTRRRQR
jgi:single-strand DNA-binding protein